jgi:hypothetical protein
VALSTERMKEWMGSDLSELDLLVIQIGGIQPDAVSRRRHRR